LERPVPVLRDGGMPLIKIEVGFRILREILVRKRDFIPSREAGLIKIPWAWRYAGK
jgi:hypothetical protein